MTLTFEVLEQDGLPAWADERSASGATTDVR